MTALYDNAWVGDSRAPVNSRSQAPVLERVDFYSPPTQRFEKGVGHQSAASTSRSHPWSQVLGHGSSGPFYTEKIHWDGLSALWPPGRFLLLVIWTEHDAASWAQLWSVEGEERSTPRQK